MISLQDECTFENMLSLCSPLSGPLTSFKSMPTLPGTEDNFLSSVEISKTSGMGGGWTYLSNPAGFGHGPTPVASGIKALAEALERYGSSITPKNILHKMTHVEVASKYRVPSLEDLQTLRPDQPGLQEFRRMKPNDAIDWVEGEDWSDPKNVQSIWYPLPLLVLNRRINLPFTTGTTSGFALGPDQTFARLGAICELIERDCFSYSWWTHSTENPHFSLHDVWDDLPVSLQQLTRNLKDKIWFVDFSQRWQIPCFAAFYFDQENQPHVACASSCNADASNALHHALGELIRVSRGLITNPERFRAVLPEKPYEKNLHNFVQQISLGLLPECYDWSHFMIEGPRDYRREAIRASTQAFQNASSSEKLEFVVRQIRAQKAQLYFFDFTPRDIAQYGLHLSRAQVTEAVPMQCTYEARPLGCKPLRDIPLEQLHLFPMPFP